MIARRNFNQFRSPSRPVAGVATSAGIADAPRAIGSMLEAVLARYGVVDAARVQVVHAAHDVPDSVARRFAAVQGRLF